MFICWRSPSIGWVKLNTDGAAKGNPGKAGAGGIIRGHRGEVHEVFALNCGSCSCTRAELCAVLHGLGIAWNGGHKKVLVSIDSEVVVNMLVKEIPTNSPYVHIVRECKAFMVRQEWEVVVEHCYREANGAADWLANLGVNLDQKLLILESIPSELREILREDLSGVARPRMVPTYSDKLG